MWPTAFLASTQRVTYALLCKPVLPGKVKPFEKVSAAIAVRVALFAKHVSQTTIFLVPSANASTARQVVAGLLVGNYAHLSGGSELPIEEARPLFKGDILLITTSVSECKMALDILPIGRQVLSEIWDVVSLSRYSSAKSTKPRVFLANPGWALSGMAARRFGAIIIDSAHPRTLTKLCELVNAASGCSDIRIVVAPPLNHNVLTACGFPLKADAWLWDPHAMAGAIRAIDELESTPVEVPTRTLWVCDSDMEADRTLETAYKLLANAMRQSNGHSYPGLQLAWSILNRMRQVAVPLAQLEQKAVESWAGGLRRRVEVLQTVEGNGNALWDSTWPKIRDAVDATYRIFLKRDESAKFWSLASRLFELLPITKLPIRVVVSTHVEADLLVRQLEDTVDGFRTAAAEGKIEVVSVSTEAKLIAEGHDAHTLLLGPRSALFRHLDVFPTTKVEEFLYPFELPIEQAALQRLYDAAEKLQDGNTREAYLSKLGLIKPSSATSSGKPCRQTIQVRHASSHIVSFATASQSSGLLDLDELATSMEMDSTNPMAGMYFDSGAAVRSGATIEVTFSRGDPAHYHASQKVDVYFTATGQIQRELVTSLRPGWQVIAFVDGRYDGLFRRLTEAIQHRLSPYERVSLELWQKAKSRLLGKHDSKRSLHVALADKGLTTAYETFATWFRDSEDATLAPQQFEEFVILAGATGAYESEKHLRQTFESVQHARGRNRAAGKSLKSLLRAIVSGSGYEDALESARKLDAALGDVLAAVEVLEVRSVHIIERKK